MDVSFSYHQVTGNPVDKLQFPQVNQDRNKGGNSPGFVADIFDERNKLLITTATYPTLEELDERLEALLSKLHSL